MSAPTTSSASRLARVLPVPAGAGLARMLVERNVMSFRHGWVALVTGFAEPVFYLFSLGVGIGALVQTVTTDSGSVVPYAAFVAPALLAASAINGAVFDSTDNVFIGFAFAAVGMFATTFMRSFLDFDYVTLAIQPMFLFSATFLPLSTYPEGVRLLVQATPLYHGVALERALMLGEVSAGILWHVAYLVVLGALGVIGTARRLEKLLLS